MQTVWFPVPVVALFRRVVNVVSAFSISQHYLAPDQSPSPSDPRYSLRWPAWLRYASNHSPQGFRRMLHVDSHTTYPEPSAYTDRTQVNDLPPHGKPSSDPEHQDQIHRLIHHPALYDPVRTPRYPIVLCHGLYGFDVRGPSAFPILQQHYWSNVLAVLRKSVGAEVLVTGVPSTGSVFSRGDNLDQFLRSKAPARGINFLAHSMGGLDCRYLISHIKPTEYAPLSLTTIATPHRGSPFMDWCSQYLGLGQRKEDLPSGHSLSEPSTTRAEPTTEEKQERAASVKTLLSLASLPSSFTTLLLSLLDSPAYANLTTHYLNTVFNPNTPDDPSVKYFSVAGRCPGMNIWHPLWLPKLVLDGFEERERARLRTNSHPLAELDSGWGNDGLVTVQSARWGEFLGVLDGCDHWEIRGARGIDVDLPSLPGADGWALGDWGKFVRAWKREEKEAAAKGAGARMSEELHEASERLRSDRREDARWGRTRPQDRAEMDSDEVVRSSTAKVSAIFDWIVDQVPSPGSGAHASSPAPSPAGSASASPAESGANVTRAKSEKPVQRNDLATKMDLERFYVALCRKLYDEGL
ncbi:alpha/beta-hydrolase [Epithele typhae]|uniref:alpha/beta-hydrolase n=1 Tax=Epithele typhae TaxID=378194 RepID=UPI0020085086|nr:alpha/beta-hydrolase [Epithele typhae]KAH9932712.1 alpha/beta-hydrolase [Epithele typhae]